MSNILIWNAQLPYIFAASELNIRMPVITCTIKPNHAQGRKRFASFDTGSSRNVNPMRRRSRMDVAPTSEMMPKMCKVSMTGNNQMESRIAAPIDVWSSHLQKVRNAPIIPSSIQVKTRKTASNFHPTDIGPSAMQKDFCQHTSRIPFPLRNLAGPDYSNIEFGAG